MTKHRTPTKFQMKWRNRKAQRSGFSRRQNLVFYFEGRRIMKEERKRRRRGIFR